MYRRVGNLHYSFQSVKAVHLQGRRNYIQIHLQDQNNIYLCWHQTADPDENEASHFCIVSVSVYTRGHRPNNNLSRKCPCILSRMQDLCASDCRFHQRVQQHSHIPVPAHSQKWYSAYWGIEGRHSM